MAEKTDFQSVMSDLQGRYRAWLQSGKSRPAWLALRERIFAAWTPPAEYSASQICRAAGLPAALVAEALREAYARREPETGQGMIRSDYGKCA